MVHKHLLVMHIHQCYLSEAALKLLFNGSSPKLRCIRSAKHGSFGGISQQLHMLLSCYTVCAYKTGHFIWHRLVWNLATIPTSFSHVLPSSPSVPNLQRPWWGWFSYRISHSSNQCFILAKPRPDFQFPLYTTCFCRTCIWSWGNTT
jgi:hypothetical protein